MGSGIVITEHSFHGIRYGNYPMKAVGESTVPNDVGQVRNFHTESYSHSHIFPQKDISHQHRVFSTRPYRLTSAGRICDSLIAYPVQYCAATIPSWRVRADMLSMCTCHKGMVAYDFRTLPHPTEDFHQDRHTNGQ